MSILHWLGILIILCGLTWAMEKIEGAAEARKDKKAIRMIRSAGYQIRSY